MVEEITDLLLEATLDAIKVLPGFRWPTNKGYQEGQSSRSVGIRTDAKRAASDLAMIPKRS
jgi:hypothetical protein